MLVLKKKYVIEFVNVWESTIEKLHYMTIIKCIVRTPEVNGYVLMFYKLQAV